MLFCLTYTDIIYYNIYIPIGGIYKEKQYLGQGMIMNEHQHKQTKNILHRLARIEGHVRAVKSMVEEGRDCADVLVQIAAVRSAIDKVGRILLEDHIESCLLSSLENGDADEQLADLRIALDRFIS